MRSIRYERLFNRNERCVIVAMDHGLFDGPITGLVNLPETARRIAPCVDGVLLSPAMLPHCADTFNYKGAPLAVVRLNWSTTYCFKWAYQRAATVPGFSPEEALRLGADLALVSLTLETGSEFNDAENVRVFRDLCGAAHRLGMPVIGEYFPLSPEKLPVPELHSKVLTGCRIIAELGADLVKTFHTCSFRDVVEACPVPVLGLGACKLPTQLRALQLAAREVADGARGVIFGRNVLQSPDPLAFQHALCDVVKHDVMPQEAWSRHGLKDSDGDAVMLDSEGNEVLLNNAATARAGETGG